MAYAYTYILASTFKRLYVGITTNLPVRIWQHKHPTNPDSFTANYKIDRLVYFEPYNLVTRAIAREKELKGWLRHKKIALIVANNPDWRDLSEEWGKPIERLSQSAEAPIEKR
jgi:putative endonuclease